MPLDRRSLLGVALLVAVLPALVIGCGGSKEDASLAATPAATPTAGSTGVAVTIHLFQFMPSPLEISAGTRVTWMNDDDILHTVTSGTPDTRTSTFDLPMPEKGASVAFTFDQPGTYTYFCSRHESMRGEVRVR